MCRKAFHLRGGEFEETSAERPGCRGKRRQLAKLDANRLLGTHPAVLKDQLRIPRDLHFTEAQTGTQHRF